MANIGPDSAYLGLVILVVNLIVSYKGFKDSTFFNRLSFQVDAILIQKDYKRLLTSGFLHANWTHLAFNMFSLFAFSETLERSIGSMGFLLIYFGSLIGGNLFSLYIHRNHGSYSAIGASGAVSGVIFAAIALFPGMKLSLLFLPIGIPSVVFGIAFVIISIRGIKSQKDNIGHEAHLGGGLIGLFLTIILVPSVLDRNPLPIAAIVIPSVIFIYLIIKKPEILLIGPKGKKPQYFSKEDRYIHERAASQAEIDRILDKIATKGFESLSQKEKDTLDKNAGKS